LESELKSLSYRFGVAGWPRNRKKEGDSKDIYENKGRRNIVSCKWSLIATRTPPSLGARKANLSAILRTRAFICGKTSTDHSMPKQITTKSPLAGITRESVESKASASASGRATAQILEFSRTGRAIVGPGVVSVTSQRLPSNAKTSLAGITRESIENKASVKQAVAKMRRQASDFHLKLDRTARKRQTDSNCRPTSFRLRTGSEHGYLAAPNKSIEA
jgi:hypothetical protein